MRIPTWLAPASVVLIAATVTACNSGSKPDSPAATTSSTSGPVSPAASSPAVSSSASGVASGGAAPSEIDACKLLTAARASALVGRQYTSAAAKTIAPGQDQCTYNASDNFSDLVIIVYQPSSGVDWQMMTSVLSGTGDVKAVGGVGDKAMVGQIELDAQTGQRLVAVQGGGGLLAGDYSGAVAVAKTVITALP